MANKRKLPPDSEIQLWYKRYLSGVSIAELSRELELKSEDSLKRWFVRNDLPTIEDSSERRGKVVAVRKARIDWKPLEGIVPARKGGGYSTFTEEEGARIRDFYLSSENIKAAWIAEHLKVSNSLIYNVINKSIKYQRPKLRQLKESDIRELHKRYMSGETLNTLSKELSAAPASVRVRFTKLGLPLKAAPSIDVEKIEDMLRNLCPATEIAAECGISIKTVNRVRAQIKKQILEKEKQ